MYLVHSFFFLYIKLFGDSMYLISDGGVKCNTLDTIEAIMLTKNICFLDGVKLDVRKSLDNVYVLSKYDDLGILTYSNNLVSKSNYNYLRKVKFPSHIFKYYIPTLEEILIKYNNDKIVALEIYDNGLDSLLNILKKYSYKYYFLGSKKIINELKEKNFDEIGVILNQEDIIIPKVNINLYDNSFLIKK